MWVFMGPFLGIFLKDIKINSEILNIIAEIDEFKGAWKQFKGISPDRLISLNKVATIESIGSSTRIEGSKLTDREIEILLKNANNHSFETRDEQEVAGYALACEFIYDHYSDLHLTENVIKQLHGILLHHAERDVRHKGIYKKIPIKIEAFDSIGSPLGVIFETTSPFETPVKMEALVQWTNTALKKRATHPLIIIAIFIVIFLAIHPFQDGNGRLSRLLTTLLMLKLGYLYVPYSSLESIIEANKESYYLALQKTQRSWQKQKPDWTSWLLFFLHCLQRQVRHLEAKLQKEKHLMMEMPALHLKILELLNSHGPLGISEITSLTKANRNTIKKALSSLVSNSYLLQHNSGKNTQYSAQV